jgi:hypothetical protein
MYGVPEEMLQVIKGLHETTSYEVKGNTRRSQPYTLERGVREGCPSSCVIFNIYHSWVMTQVQEALRFEVSPDVGVLVQSFPQQACATPLHNTVGPTHRSLLHGDVDFHVERILDVLFADDTTMLTREEHREQVERVTMRVMKEWGETVHPGKTDRLRLDRPLEEPHIDQLVEFKEAVRLLGCWFEATGGMGTDTEKRLAVGRSAWGRLHKTLKYSGFSARQRTVMVKACVESSLVYGCQCRRFSAVEFRQYCSFMNRGVRRVCRGKAACGRWLVRKIWPTCPLSGGWNALT